MVHCMAQHRSCLLALGPDLDRVRVLVVLRGVGPEEAVKQPVKRSGGGG